MHEQTIKPESIKNLKSTGKNLREKVFSKALPRFHIVVLVPCKMPAGHEPQPDQNANKAQFPFKFTTFCQFCCNVKPVSKVNKLAHLADKETQRRYRKKLIRFSMPSYFLITRF